MGIEGTTGVQGSSWAGRAVCRNAGPGSGQGQPRAYNPQEAKTAQEALAHIDRLYKAGRMEDLPAILRRSQVFREAWLMLQQSPSADIRTVAEITNPAERENASAPAHLPVSYPALPGRRGCPELGSGSLKETIREGVPRMSAEAMDLGVERGPLPAGKADSSLRAGLRAYLSHDRYYAREKARVPQLSLRV